MSGQAIKLEPPALCAMRLLAELFEERGKHEKLLAALWETDPNEFGTDSAGIALLKGRAEAWGRASEILKSEVAKHTS